MGGTFADIKAKATRAERTVPLCVVGDLVLRHDEARARWMAAVDADTDSNEWPAAPARYDELAAVEAEILAASDEFRFTNLGSRAWRALIEQYPPPEDSYMRWDPNTFPVAAIAATCVEPEMTYGDVEELIDLISDGQFTKLWQAVLDLNIGDDIPKFVTGTGATASSGPPSTTPPATASPTPSS